MSDPDPVPSHWFLCLVRRGRYAAAARARWADPETRDKLTAWQARRSTPGHSHRHTLSTRQRMADAARARWAERLDPLRGEHGLGLALPPSYLRTRAAHRYETVKLAQPVTGIVADELWRLAHLAVDESRNERMTFELPADGLLHYHGWRNVRQADDSPQGKVRISGGTHHVGLVDLRITLSNGQSKTLPVMMAEHPRNS